MAGEEEGCQGECWTWWCLESCTSPCTSPRTSAPNTGERETRKRLAKDTSRAQILAREQVLAGLLGPKDIWWLFRHRKAEANANLSTGASTLRIHFRNHAIYQFVRTQTCIVCHRMHLSSSSNSSNSSSRVLLVVLAVAVIVVTVVAVPAAVVSVELP